jgi:hypothetical protein
MALYDELIHSAGLDDEFIDPGELQEVLAGRRLLPQYRPPRAGRPSPDDTNIFGNWLERRIELHLEVQASPGIPLTKGLFLGWYQALAAPGSLAGLGTYRPASFGPCPCRPGPEPLTLDRDPAVPADLIAREMDRFFSWFNSPWPGEPAVKAALAHLRILIIRPFAAGSGQLARLLAQMVLAGRKDTGLYLSLSRTMNLARAEYWQNFQEALYGDLDLTASVSRFLMTLIQAVRSAGRLLDSLINKTIYWAKFRNYPLNQRQKNVLALLFDDFIGLITPRRYAEITKCSDLTAEKEFNQLVSSQLIQPKFLPPASRDPKARPQDFRF